MISVGEYRERVLSLVAPLPVETLPLSEVLGRALAASVTSTLALPPFDNSAMDGYAVRAAEIAPTPCELKVSADIPAGSGMPAPLEPGTVARIMTGAPVPPGADSVVPVEHTDGGTAVVHINRTPRLGANIRRSGEDVRSGDTVLEAGDELTPARISVAAAVGRATLDVHRAPRVGIVSTGSELVAPGDPLPDGSIYESNGPLLAACVDAAGGVPVQRQFVTDDPASARAAFAELVTDVDLLITSGGISAGAYEVVKDVFTGQGTSSVEFVRVAIQPGMPQGCGSFAGCPVITVPGNPVSAFVSFVLFGYPALRRLGGHRVLDRPVRRGRLAAAVRQRPAKQQYLRVRTTAEGVEPVGGTGSHLLAALAQADALAVIPPGDGELAPGAAVDLIDIGL
jgi:molybdopterin molybdotransferase